MQVEGCRSQITRITRRRRAAFARIRDMAFIKYVSAKEWKLDADNILRIHGTNPPVLRAHLALYRTIMHGESPLSRKQREMLAVVVSAINGCHY